jgi:phage tail-like protein
MAGIVWGTRAKLSPTTKTMGDPNQAHRFTCEIGGVLVGGVHTIEGLEFEHEVIEYHDGDNGTTQFRPGRQKQGRVKLTRDFSATKEFHDWRKTVVDGKVSRQSVSIVMLADDGTEAIRYNLYECWPTKYYGPSLSARNSSNATEAIEICFETMEMK